MNELAKQVLSEKKLLKKSLLIWVRIGLQNGWSFIFTIILTFIFFWCLGKNIEGIKYSDAYNWAAFSSLMASENSSLNQDFEGTKSTHHNSGKDSKHGKVIHGILLVVTYSFIFFNTIIYLWENKKTDRLNCGWLSTIAWWFIFVCVIITVIWILKIIMGWSFISDYEDEKVALLIFGIFLFVDLVNYLLYRGKIKDNPNDIALIADSGFALNQALLVDLPVIIGIFISIYLAGYLTQRFDDSDIYLSGFFSGATVMHLAASQVIFSILACRKDYSIFHGTTL